MDEKKEKFGIYDVIGPDEYTEHIDNNAYTNYMAAYCVRTANTYAEDLKTQNPKLYMSMDRKFQLQRRRRDWEYFLKNIYLAFSKRGWDYPPGRYVPV
mgnify:CR=1 FL=1